MVARGPGAPAAPPLLASLPPPDGAGGFGRAVARYARHFFRLALCGHNVGVRYRSAIASGCLWGAGSRALDPLWPWLRYSLRHRHNGGALLAASATKPLVFHYAAFSLQPPTPCTPGHPDALAASIRLPPDFRARRFGRFAPALPAYGGFGSPRLAAGALPSSRPPPARCQSPVTLPAAPNGRGCAGSARARSSVALPPPP